MSSFPDYYTILGVQKTATSDEVRQAYKKESLKYFQYLYLGIGFLMCCGFRTHPDRLVKPTDAERKAATEKFQVISHKIYLVVPLSLHSLDRQSQMHTSSFLILSGGDNTILCTRQRPTQIRAMTLRHLQTFLLDLQVCLVMPVLPMVLQAIVEDQIPRMFLLMFSTKYSFHRVHFEFLYSLFW